MGKQILKFTFKYLYLLIAVLLIATSCIAENYRTLLRNEDTSYHGSIVIFEQDSTALYLSAHMKEWNNYWGIIKDDPIEGYDELTVYIEIKNQSPVLIQSFNIDIEAIKDGEIHHVKEGTIDPGNFALLENRIVGITDTIKNEEYQPKDHNLIDYLFIIESQKMIELVGCDTIIIKPEMHFSFDNREYFISRSDTLFRKTKKMLRFFN